MPTEELTKRGTYGEVRVTVEVYGLSTDGLVATAEGIVERVEEVLNVFDKQLSNFYRPESHADGHTESSKPNGFEDEDMVLKVRSVVCLRGKVSLAAVRAHVAHLSEVVTDRLVAYIDGSDDSLQSELEDMVPQLV